MFYKFCVHIVAHLSSLLFHRVRKNVTDMYINSTYDRRALSSNRFCSDHIRRVVDSTTVDIFSPNFKHKSKIV